MIQNGHASEAARPPTNNKPRPTARKLASRYGRHPLPKFVQSQITKVYPKKRCAFAFTPNLRKGLYKISKLDNLLIASFDFTRKITQMNYHTTELLTENKSQ